MIPIDKESIYSFDFKKYISFSIFGDTKPKWFIRWNELCTVKKGKFGISGFLCIKTANRIILRKLTSYKKIQTDSQPLFFISCNFTYKLLH